MQMSSIRLICSSNPACQTCHYKVVLSACELMKGGREKQCPHVQVAQLAGIPVSVIDLAKEKGLELEEKLKASPTSTLRASADLFEGLNKSSSQKSGGLTASLECFS